MYWKSFLRALFVMAILMGSCSGAGSEITSSRTGKIAQSQNDRWRLMSEEEKQRAIALIINRPLGIAALNQLAIEGFVGPDCNRNFFTLDEAGFQTLMQVKCSSPRGASIAVAYDELRITFYRFEDNIENFTIETR